MVAPMDWPWLTTLTIALHVAVVGGTGLRIVMMRPLPGVALAWILLVAALPAAGLVIYVAFGERRIGRRRTARLAMLQQPREEVLRVLRDMPSAQVAWETLPQAAATLDRLWRANHGVPTLAGNDLELLTSAESTLRALLIDIDAARSSLHLEFYIWHPGGLADEVAAAVERAARRGVTCRLLVDALGSKTWLQSASPTRLRAAGVEVVAALPAGAVTLLFRRNDLRNHRKIAVIDGAIAYTGSMNLVDPSFFKQDAGVGQWIDAMVRIRGPAVAALLGVFLGDWFLETGAAVDQLIASSDLRGQPTVGDAAVQVLQSGPAYGGDRLLQMLTTLLFAARSRIVITTPYFVPDESTLRALRSAAARGVEVVLVVPAKVDSRLVRYASRSYYDDLAAAGVRILLHRGGLLHTKSIVVDGDVAMFGTHNFDARSMYLNFEVSLFVYDRKFVAQLAALQASYLDPCLLLDAVAWRRRGLVPRLAENVLRLFSPLL
jgi:cardiolipin synthase